MTKSHCQLQRVVDGVNQTICYKRSSVQGIPRWVHKQDFSSSFSAISLYLSKVFIFSLPFLLPIHRFQRLFTFGMQLVQTRQALQESRFVERFQQHGKSFRLVRPEDLPQPKTFINRSTILFIVRTARRTVSLHPVQRSYAAPTICMLRNCARNPRN